MIEAQKLPEGSSLREPPGANKGGTIYRFMLWGVS